MTQKEYKEKIIDKFVFKKYETNLYVQGRHLLYLIKPKNTESDDPRLLITYNVEDASQSTPLYFYHVAQEEGEPSALGINLFDKVEIDGTEVSVTDLDAASGTTTQLSVGEHTVAYTLKDPTFIGLEFDEQTGIPLKVGATFMQCNAITSVTIPNSVTSIGDSAFSRCSSLTSVTIPNSVTSIGNNAFGDCSSLANVTIPNSVIRISNQAFINCISLTSIDIPNSVTSIGDNAFDYCTSLASVNIGDGVTSIGDSAFYGCGGLTSVTIPNSVTSIGNEAFCGCHLDSASATAIEAINPNATRCRKA